MPFPVASVAIAFDDGPYVLSPTWTDVTSYVYSMSTERGRSDDWGTFNGSASVVLNNRARTFDPFYTAGPYYGKLLPRRQILIQATYDSQTYAVFRGFIDGFPAAWTDAGTDSTVTLSCFDAMQLLGQVQLPTDWSRSYILSTSPRHYWTMDDPITPFTAAVETDIGSVPQNLRTLTNAAAAGQMAVGLVNNCLGGVGLNNDSIATNGTGSDPVVFSTDADFSVSAWVVLGSSSDGAQTIFGGAVSNFLFYLEGLTTGKFNFVVQTGSGGSPNTWTTTTVSDITNSSESLHIACVWTASTKTAKIYINGIDATGARTTSTAFLVLGANTDVFSVSQGPIQQAVIWTSAISQATVQTIIKYSTVAFLETTAARVSRIIAETPFSPTLVSATGTLNILDITDGAVFATPELQRTANTEGAPLFVTKAGVLTQKATYAQFTDAKSFTSQATYGFGGNGLDPSIEIEYDGDSMRNVIEAQMSGGGSYKATGVVATSVYGQATQSLDAYFPTLAQATTVGQLLVGFGQYVYPKFSDFQVVISPDANWAATLTLELLERITVAVKPPTGNTITKDLQVSTIRHDVVPGQWTTTLNGSNRWAADFRLNSSYLDGPDVIVYTG